MVVQGIRLHPSELVQKSDTATPREIAFELLAEEVREPLPVEEILQCIRESLEDVCVVGVERMKLPQRKRGAV